jgi:tetratricopeptide (TPR) repeat protein
VSAESISDASSTISSLRSLDTPQHQDPRIDLVESLAASRRSDYKVQQVLAESAAKKAHATGARLLWARAKMQEGWALDDQTQSGGALKAYREAQPVFEAAGDSDHAATLLDDIGIVLQEQGDLKGAETALQEAQRRFREIGDQKGLGASLTNLGQLYHAQGDLTSAVELYREAINIFHKNARTDNENAAMNNLGGVLFERGDFREAEKIYETILQVREKQGDKSGVAYAKSNLAAALWVRGKLDESATLLEEALRTFQEIGDRSATTAAEAGYTRVLISKRDFSAARRALSQAAKISQDINSKGDAAGAQILLAQVAFSEGHPQQVDEAALRSAIEEMHLQQRGGDEMEGLAIEIQVLLAKGKTDEAQQILTRAEEIQNTTWLANYRLSLASAEIDAKQGKTNISRREVQSERSKAEKAGCGACELDARVLPSKAQVQNRALTARQLF